jgi:hypothetical protein
MNDEARDRCSKMPNALFRLWHEEDELFSTRTTNAKRLGVRAAIAAAFTFAQ